MAEPRDLGISGEIILHAMGTIHLLRNVNLSSIASRSFESRRAAMTLRRNSNLLPLPASYPVKTSPITWEAG